MCIYYIIVASRKKQKVTICKSRKYLEKTDIRSKKRRAGNGSGKLLWKKIRALHQWRSATNKLPHDVSPKGTRRKTLRRVKTV